MSMYVTGRATGDALGTMQTPVLVRPVRPLRRIVRQLAVPRRDYSGITIDPTDGSFLGGERICQDAGGLAGELGTWLSNFTLGAADPT